MTCSLSRTHLIRTCFVDFDRSIVLVAEAGWLMQAICTTDCSLDARASEQIGIFEIEGL